MLFVQKFELFWATMCSNGIVLLVTWWQRNLSIMRWTVSINKHVNLTNCNFSTLQLIYCELAELVSWDSVYWLVCSSDTGGDCNRQSSCRHWGAPAWRGSRASPVIIDACDECIWWKQCSDSEALWQPRPPLPVHAQVCCQFPFPTARFDHTDLVRMIIDTLHISCWLCPCIVMLKSVYYAGMESRPPEVTRLRHLWHRDRSTFTEL